MITKMYAVKVRVAIPGFKTKFYHGLVVTHNPKKAQDLAIDRMLHSVIRSNPDLSNILNRDNITATKCEKVKDDFFINEKTDKK